MKIIGPTPPSPKEFVFVLSVAEARHLYVISNWYTLVVDKIPVGTSPARNFSSKDAAKAFLLDMFEQLRPLIEP